MNPTYTPTASLPNYYTWGCPPGFLCHPPHTEDRASCNVEAGLPADNYVCDPANCIPSPRLVYNPSWETSNFQHYNISNYYFNLDPEDFGLDYLIFQLPSDITSYYTKRNGFPRQDGFLFLWGLQVGEKAKKDISDIPGVCYNDCNDAALEAESSGKTPELCDSDSAFSVGLGNCRNCISHYARSASEIYSQTLLPSFAQFLDYCSEVQATASSTTEPSTTTSTATTITSATVVTNTAFIGTSAAISVTGNQSFSSRATGQVIVSDTLNSAGRSLSTRTVQTVTQSSTLQSDSATMGQSHLEDTTTSQGPSTESMSQGTSAGSKDHRSTGTGARNQNKAKKTQAAASGTFSSMSIASFTSHTSMESTSPSSSSAVLRGSASDKLVPNMCRGILALAILAVFI
ncbi:hypothetical protein N7462_000033 [Penicillium macrosclerotiorum]|uniref:uncharacterized protein n=1 Tax=Penicillium macrosclerotiorum TaxID=303699 RepID=UPI002549931B|nr:uncharacterized protein N7462_000033 [Penicillium macrosclerotiorum]KAJ5698028.1 hypothetical protein N7462_000033 [Penicillium macrosclerotiorum]